MIVPLINDHKVFQKFFEAGLLKVLLSLRENSVSIVLTRKKCDGELSLSSESTQA